MNNASLSFHASPRRTAIAAVSGVLLACTAATAFMPAREIGRIHVTATPDVAIAAVGRVISGLGVEAGLSDGVLRVYGPDALLTMPGASPIDFAARATSWLAVVQLDDPDSAIWFVFAPAGRGLTVRYGVFQRRPASRIKRALDALTRLVRTGASGEDRRVIDAVNRELAILSRANSIGYESSASAFTGGVVTYDR